MEIAFKNFNQQSAKVKELVQKYYHVAYDYAHKDMRHYIPEDIKETVACNALVRAAEQFDPKKNPNFEGYLKLCIHRSLVSEINRIKRQPRLVSEELDQKTGEMKDVFELHEFPMVDKVESSDWSAIDDFKQRVLNRLNNPTEKQIFEFLMDDQVTLAQYAPNESKLNTRVIAGLIKKSTVRASALINKVRRVMEEAYKEIYA